MKTCNLCGQTLPFSDFYKHRDAKDGLRPTCKACTLKKNREYGCHKYNPETWQRHYAKNKEQIKERKLSSYHSKSLEEKKESKLKHRYGITLQEYTRMMEEQGGLCLICQEPMTEPQVDHCHSTGLVRGLLCKSCNLALGYLKDDPERMRRAIDYLAKQPSQPLIGLSVGSQARLGVEGGGPDVRVAEDVFEDSQSSAGHQMQTG